MRYFFVCAAIGMSALLPTTASAQSTTKKLEPTITKAISTSTPTKQWEYLALSLGKTYFYSATEAETKQLGLSKLLSYSKAGVVTADEAILTQQEMDTLGRFGWELVGVVGAIGGDQEMLFKRPYDPDQSKREDVLIRQEGERLLALQKKEAASRRAKEATATPSGELVDLDAVEFGAATLENRSKQESRLKNAVESVTTYKVVSAEPVSSAYSPTSTKATIQVVIDGTEKLLKDGNKYRAKEAEDLVKEAAMSYYRSSGLKLKESYDEPTMFLSLKDVTIGVQVVINFEGKRKIVAQETVGGYW